MRIGVDAMGGDTGPPVVVPGAVAGARLFGVELVLVGRTTEIEAQLRQLDTSGVSLSIIEANEAVEMDERPVRAARAKSNSSIRLALRDMKAGRSCAVLSAGNSGAVAAASLLELGLIPGVDRPAIACILPGATGRTLILDLGAVTDPKPPHLLQFAYMGSAYARLVFGIASPRVGLLSNGREPTKGNHLIRAVYSLLAEAPGIDFAGNIEGTDVLGGVVDVVVTDGFTGNIALKVAEGVAAAIGEALRTELGRSLPRKVASLPLRSAFGAVRAMLDPSELGAAPLLGVNGVVLIAHGQSSETAIRNAVGTAKRAAEQQLAEVIRASVATTQHTGDHLRTSAGTTEAGDTADLAGGGWARSRG